MDSDALFRVAFWALLGVLLVIRASSVLRVRRAGERLLPDWQAVKREGVWQFAARVIAFLGLLAFLALYALDHPWLAGLLAPFPAWLRWSGAALTGLSLVLWAWAQWTLGVQWSPQLQVREQHVLVTDGPYARIRHPLYTALIGFGTGMALVSANWLLVAAAVLVVVGLQARIPKEEQMLLQEFGDRYADYMRRTGSLLPKGA